MTKRKAREFYVVFKGRGYWNADVFKTRKDAEEFCAGLKYQITVLREVLPPKRRKKK